MQDPTERRPRRGRRGRRIARGAIKVTFWALVIAGTFVLGLGYGRTVSRDDELRTDKVTVTQDRGAIEATLPTKTVTVTKTVKVVAPVRSATRTAAPKP